MHETHEGSQESLEKRAIECGSVVKNKLQYMYTITVFFGVLMTAYLMMNREGNARIPLRSFEGAALRTEAQVLDPGLKQLFEMENALRAERNEIPKNKLRLPTSKRSD